MWHLVDIPQVAHFYWGGATLSYLRFLTVKTFQRFNPGWRARFYCPKVPYSGKNPWGNGVGGDKDLLGANLSCKDYFGEVGKLPNTEVVQVDFETLGIGDVPDVYRSDLLRLKVLGEDGGLYSDMDIIYFRPMEGAYFNSSEQSGTNTVISFHPTRREYSIGFLMSGNNNPLFQSLYRQGIDAISACSSPTDYQRLGVKMWQGSFADPDAMIGKFPSLKIHNIEMELTYAIDYVRIGAIYEGNVEYRTPKTIALHWYGGHPLGKKWENNIQEGTVKNFNTTLANTIKDALSKTG